MFLDISNRSSQFDEDELDDRTMEAFINAFNAYKSPTKSRYSVRSLLKKEVITRTPTFPGSCVMSALAEKALERSISDISLSSADIDVWMSAPSSPLPKTDTVTLSLSPVSSPCTIVPPPSPPPSMTSDSSTEEKSEPETTPAINPVHHYRLQENFPPSPPRSITSLSEPRPDALPTPFEPESILNPSTASFKPLTPLSTVSFHPAPLSLSQCHPSTRKESLFTFLSQTAQTRLSTKSTLCLGCEYLVDGGPVEYPHHSFCAFKHDRLLGHSGGTFKCLQGKCGFETLFEGLLVEHCEEVHCFQGEAVGKGRAAWFGHLKRRDGGRWIGLGEWE
ncbi:hypothetical protein Vi05172_g12280 [Venturia inaequalis]|nr:hypothetical protein Vi05172_g12280 [Venturia inaequalis]